MPVGRAVAGGIAAHLWVDGMSPSFPSERRGSAMEKSAAATANEEALCLPSLSPE